jgi:hypothetical protein
VRPAWAPCLAIVAGQDCHEEGVDSLLTNQSANMDGVVARKITVVQAATRRMDLAMSSYLHLQSASQPRLHQPPPLRPRSNCPPMLGVVSRTMLPLVE